MISQIQLGNFFNQNGRTVVTGSSSGLDIESLVNGLAEAKRQPAVILESKVEYNQKVSSALSEFRDKLDVLRDASNFLRNPPGVQNAADNIFDYRSASISSNSAVAGSNYLNITVEPGASLSQYDVTVDALATRNNFTTNTFALADADTSVVGGGGPLNAGTLRLGASATPITLSVGDSLNNVIAKINAVKDLSGVEASAIKINDGNYRISFKSIDTGIDQNYGIIALNPGIFNTGFAIMSFANDAQITLDGTTISRSSNNIDDVVDGITFNLLQTTPVGTELAVDVDADRELAKQGIMNFVNAFNDLRLFASRQTATGNNGLPLEDSVLANNSTLTSTFSRINAELSRAVAGITSGDPSRLSELGIKFSDFPGDEETPFTRNILTVDEEKLDAMLESNFDKVRKVFEFDYISDNSDLQVFRRTNALAVSDVDLNLDPVTHVYTATYGTTTINLDFEELASGGVVLTGPAGSSIAGLMMIYADAAPTTVNLSMSQGIGDRMFNTLDTLLAEETGAVQVAIDALSTSNERYEKEISKIDDQIAKYRDQLLDKFSALEKAISAANTLLQSLEAQANAQSS